MAFPADDTRNAPDYQARNKAAGAPDWPATKAVPVTPSDSTDLSPAWPRALYVGTSGNLVIDTVEGDTDVVFKGASGIIPVRAKRVKTASTAADIVALY